MLQRSKNILKAVGPGFIIASAVLGPGSITVSSMIGSSYGFSMLWIIVISGISMFTYTSMTSRFGTLSNVSLLQVIASNYGKWFAILIGISAFIAAASFQFGNNLGIGIGMYELTGIAEYLWSVVFTLLAAMLIFWAKNLYKILEKIMIFMVMIMILAFISNLILVKPNLISTLNGFVPNSFSSKYLSEMIAVVATTFSLAAALFQSYLVQDKGWKIESMKDSMRDNIAGIFILCLISSIIIITSATALHPYGIKVNSAAEMAIQLESLLGIYSKYIFSLGLCAAAFSSLLVNSMISGCLLSDALGLGKTLGEKYPRIFTMITLIIGMVVAVFFRGDVIYALILAQASSILGVPLISTGIFLVANNKNVMGKYVNGITQNVLAVLGFILICVMVYFIYVKLIHFVGEVI